MLLPMEQGREGWVTNHSLLHHRNLTSHARRLSHWNLIELKQVVVEEQEQVVVEDYEQVLVV